MGAVHLDFVPATRWHSMAFPCALLIVSVLCLGMCFLRWHLAKDELGYVSSATDSLTAQLDRQRAKKKPLNQPPDFATPVSKVLTPLRYPWGPILSDIEFANGDKVNIARIEHKYGEPTLRISANSATYADVQALVLRLNMEGNPLNWQTRTVSRTPNGMRVVLEGRWRE